MIKELLPLFLATGLAFQACTLRLDVVVYDIKCKKQTRGRGNVVKFYLTMNTIETVLQRLPNTTNTYKEVSRYSKPRYIRSEIQNKHTTDCFDHVKVMLFSNNKPADQVTESGYPVYSEDFIGMNTMDTPKVTTDYKTNHYLNGARLVYFKGDVDCGRQLPAYTTIAFDYTYDRSSKEKALVVKLSGLFSHAEKSKEKLNKGKTVRFGSEVQVKEIDRIAGPSLSAVKFLEIAEFDQPVQDTNGNERYIIRSDELNAEGEIKYRPNYKALEGFCRLLILKAKKKDSPGSSLKTGSIANSDEPAVDNLQQQKFDDGYLKMVEQTYPDKGSSSWIYKAQFDEFLANIRKSGKIRYNLYSWNPKKDDVSALEINFEAGKSDEEGNYIL